MRVGEEQKVVNANDVKVELGLVNNYGSDISGVRKMVKCTLGHKVSIFEIQRYIEEEFELNLEDMWKMIGTFRTSQSDLRQYNNMECIILGKLGESEYNKEDLENLMYEIMPGNGEIIQAFEDEVNCLVYEVPVTWEMCGTVNVKSNSIQGAIEAVELDEDNILIPKGEYVDSSLRLSSENTEELKAMIESI